MLDVLAAQSLGEESSAGKDHHRPLMHPRGEALESNDHYKRTLGPGASQTPVFTFYAKRRGLHHAAHATHAAHAAAGTASHGATGLRLVGHDGFGGQEE